MLKRADNTDVRIIPAFFELLLFLKKEKRSFTLCFRTFGADLEDVAAELRSFCEGTHPYYPGVRMDGTDGEPDYRMSTSDKMSCGTFHREAGACSLVMGTQEQPGEGKYRSAKDKSIGFYDDWPGLEIISGFDAVAGYLTERFGRCGTIGIRDYFGYWKAKRMTSEGGKLFFYDPRACTKRHEVFFDDNISFDDGYIVQPVNLMSPDQKPWVNALLETHLVRAEPLWSVVRNDYFISELARLEEALDRKQLARERLCRIIKKVARMKNVAAAFSKSKPDNLKDYDAWSKKRHDNSRLPKPVPDMSDAKAF